MWKFVISCQERMAKDTFQGDKKIHMYSFTFIIFERVTMTKNMSNAYFERWW